MQTYNHEYLRKYSLLLLFSLIWVQLSIAQNKADQLLQQLEQTQDELSKLTILDNLVDQSLISDHTQVDQYLDQAFSIIEKYNLSERQADFMIKKAKLN